MPEKLKCVVRLDPNSGYHQMLIKKHGRAGALACLQASSLQYSFDVVSNMSRKLSPLLAKTKK